VRYVVVKRGDELVLERRNTPPQTLRATEKDVFAAGNLGLRFDRDANGRVTGFAVQAGRVRNIRFVRVD
jgi:hypothetical protein